MYLREVRKNCDGKDNGWKGQSKDAKNALDMIGIDTVAQTKRIFEDLINNFHSLRDVVKGFEADF